ncbi:CaiB/BaiF CoA transferase family protein [Mycolicibacterium septicum]|uniref:CaiB/BaiF CoA transferase family protein n=1 Tax=Mycolicibacterium septicum TaxID=98668 RepID=UPI0023622248|nr:CaiB/BaiF CoA-transferase family protein [Mycolicibacterium septicum]
MNSQPSPAGPLAGIKVLGLTRARAGPTCTRQLADLGADVIQISAPGEDTSSAAFGGSDGFNLNRNKRSMTLDLTTPADLEVFLELVDRSDVMVENFRPGVKHRLGIDPESLMKRNPRLVYASLSGFGQDGPYAGRPAVDQIIQGMSGLMSVTGPPGAGPWRAGIAVFDVATGQMLAQGVIAALFARERTGRGQWVHTSLLETAISMMDFQAVRWLIDGVVPESTGNSHPSMPLQGGATLPTSDGYINVAALGGIDQLLTALGLDAIDDEPADRLQERVAALLATKPTAEWVDQLAGTVPCGPVLHMDEVFADPQVEHLHMSCPVTAEGGRVVNVLRTPLNFSETKPSVRRGPYRPGDHTEEVLAELTHDNVDARRLP